jgi:ferric iron reductase protein FhuF
VTSEPEAIPLPDLLQPASMDGLMARYTALFPGGDRMAVLSMWSQYYLLALVPAVVEAALSHRALPVALEGMTATLSDTGQPRSLGLPDEGCAGICVASCLTPLIRIHLQPLAVCLAQAGLPPRVLWGNAAAVLTWALANAAPGETADVSRALMDKHWVDGGANPLCTVLACDGGCVFSRRVCCLRFRLPGMAICPGCPKLCTHRRPNGHVSTAPSAG